MKVVKRDTNYWIYCPGCDETHRIPVNARSGPSWNFTGTLDNPTFAPSVRIFIPEHESVGPERVKIKVPEVTCCHFFIQDAKLKYCTDCDHKYNGQTIDLPDIPEDSWLLKE